MDPQPADALQFDRIEVDGTATATGVVCSVCHRSIPTEYYDINAHVVCDECRVRVEASAESPAGIGPLLRAGGLGLGAAILGAIVYYAVIAIASLEIGLIAILCGYMVGKAVRYGAGGRGGRRFQILAITLTYLSVALAYTPIAVRGIRERPRRQEASGTAASGAVRAAPESTASPRPGAGERPSLGGFILGLAFLAAFILALPVLIIVGSLPSGLLSAAIIGFGMHRAWQITGAPSLTVLGPYQVSQPVAATAT